MEVGVAAAAGPSPTAAELGEKARRAYDLGRYPEAIDWLSQAYEASGNSILLFDIGEIERMLGNQAVAIRTYQNYLRRDPNGTRRDLAQKRLAELESGQGPAAVTPPTSASPVGETPAGGAAQPAVPPPFDPAQANASGAVLSQPPVGVDLQAKASPSAQPAHSAWIPWTLAGTTLALGAGAIVYGLSTSQHYNDLSSSCGQTTTGCTSDQVQSVKHRALVTNLLWGLTGLAAVGTGIAVYVDTSDAGVSALWTF